MQRPHPLGPRATSASSSASGSSSRSPASPRSSRRATLFRSSSASRAARPSRPTADRRDLRQRRRRRAARAGRDAPEGHDGRLTRRRARNSARRSAKVEAALPGSRVASYASTHDRAFVSEDGRTTFALVYIPAKGGVDPGRPRRDAAQAALEGVTVGGAPVEVTGLDALRASAGENEGDGIGVLIGALVAALGALLVLDLRLPLVDGARAAADGVRRRSRRPSCWSGRSPPSPTSR